MKRTTLVSLLLTPMLLLAACGDDDDAVTADADQATAGAGDDGADAPIVAVTTNILGDVVANLFGDAVEVDVVMPVGVDPHDFQASAQEAAALRDAEILVVNGEGFESGLAPVIESAEADGVTVYEAIEGTSELAFEESHGHGEEGHSEDDHAEEGQSEEGHAGEKDHDGHDHGSVDPHFFTDPARMAEAADGIVDAVIAAIPALDTDEVREQADGYIAELEALDAEVEATLSVIEDADRVLVTNHEVFGYFADRYDFEVVGVIVSGGGTSDSVSGGELDALAGTIVDEGVSAIFVDASSSAQLAETLAGEVGGDVEVVELYTESLGGPETDGSTYIDMVTANATRIATALGS